MLMDRILKRILTFSIICLLAFLSVYYVCASFSQSQPKSPQNNFDLTSLPAQPVEVAAQRGEKQGCSVIPVNAEIEKGETQTDEYDTDELSSESNEEGSEIVKTKNNTEMDKEPESKIIEKVSEKMVSTLDTDGDETPDSEDLTPIPIEKEIPLYWLIIVGLVMLGIGSYVGRKMMKKVVTKVELPTIARGGAEAKITVDNKDYNLTKDSVTIGRGKNADIHIEDPDQAVSRIHARIYKNKDQYWIEDNNSTHGTFIYKNGTYKKIQKWALHDGDTIVLCHDPTGGKQVLIMFETAKRGDYKPKAAKQEAEVMVGGKRIPLTKTVMTIGRSENADIRIPDPDMLVSRIHARIYKDKGQYWIEDNNSTHGTFIYQKGQYKKIQKWALYDGDVIVLCHDPQGGKEFPLKFKMYK